MRGGREPSDVIVYDDDEAGADGLGLELLTVVCTNSAVAVVLFSVVLLLNSSLMSSTVLLPVKSSQ